MRSSSSANSLRSLLRALVLAVVVGVAAIASTPQGLLVGQGDAPTYLSAAENIARGGGYTTSFGEPEAVVELWPPGYATLLSLGISSGFEPVGVARFLSVLAISTLSFAIFVYANNRGLGVFGSTVAALVAAALSFRYMVEPRSELPYALILVAAVILLERFIASRNIRYVLAAAVFASLSVVFRFVGLALVATVVIVVLLRPHLKPRDRIGLAAVAGVLGLIPFAVFSAGSRESMWHPPTLDDLKIMVNAITGWFVPPVGSPIQRLVLLATIAVAGIIWVAHHSRESRPKVNFRHITDSPPAVLSALMHFLAVLAAMTFLDEGVRLNTRILFPVALSLLMAAVGWFDRMVSPPSAKSVFKHVVAVFGLAALVASSWSALVIAQSTRAGELGYRSASFLDSPVTKAVRNAARDSVVYSNVPDGLWVAGIDGVQWLPSKGKSEPLDRLRIELADGNAVVYFYKAHDRSYLVDEETLRGIASSPRLEDETGFLLTESFGS